MKSLWSNALKVILCSSLLHTIPAAAESKESSELRGMSASRMAILKVVQARTDRALKSETELTVKSWTNTNDHVLVVARPQASLFHDRVVFALVKKDTSSRKPAQSSVQWKIVDFKVSTMSKSPLKSWEKKHKVLPKDLFMLAQIALQVED